MMKDSQKPTLNMLANQRSFHGSILRDLNFESTRQTHDNQTWINYNGSRTKRLHIPPQ